MVHFSETETSLELIDIKEVEEFLNLKFPAQYVDHLLRYNGGRCEPNVFTFVEKGNRTESNIDWFLAIYEGECGNLIKYAEAFKIDKKRLPSHMLPFAHDPGGNLICISCGAKDEGKIYFWDHENEVDYSDAEDDNYSNLYLIENTLYDFLNSLKDFPSSV